MNEYLGQEFRGLLSFLIQRKAENEELKKQSKSIQKLIKKRFIKC